MRENDLFAEMVAVDKDLRLGIGLWDKDDDTVFEGHWQLDFGKLFFYELATALYNHIIAWLHI